MSSVGWLSLLRMLHGYAKEERKEIVNQIAMGLAIGNAAWLPGHTIGKEAALFLP